MNELLAQGFSDVKASFGPDRARVAVEAPSGEARRAAAILDRHGPLAPSEAGDEDDLAPARARSQALHKARDSATPLSNMFGWSVLSDYRSPFWPEALVADPTPLSNRFGWPVLYGAPAEAASPAPAPILAPIAPIPSPAAPAAEAPRAVAAPAPTVAADDDLRPVVAAEEAQEAVEPPETPAAGGRKRGRRGGKGKDRA